MARRPHFHFPRPVPSTPGPSGPGTVAKLRFGPVGRPRWAVISFPCGPRTDRHFVCWMRCLAVRCSRAANTASVACHGSMRVQAHPNRAVEAACVHAAAAVLTKTLILTPLLKAHYFSVFHGVDGCHTVPAPSCMHRCRPTPPIPRAGAVLGPGQHTCPSRDSITTWKWESMEWPNRARDTHKFNCWMRCLAVCCSRAANMASVACHGAIRVQAHPNRAVEAACVHAAAAVLTKTLILTPLLKAHYFSVFHGVDGSEVHLPVSYRYCTFFKFFLEWYGKVVCVKWYCLFDSFGCGSHFDSHNLGLSRVIQGYPSEGYPGLSIVM